MLLFLIVSDFGEPKDIGLLRLRGDFDVAYWESGQRTVRTSLGDGIRIGGGHYKDAYKFESDPSKILLISSSRVLVNNADLMLGYPSGIFPKLYWIDTKTNPIKHDQIYWMFVEKLPVLNTHSADDQDPEVVEKEVQSLQNSDPVFRSSLKELDEINKDGRLINARDSRRLDHWGKRGDKYVLIDLDPYLRYHTQKYNTDAQAVKRIEDIKHILRRSS